MYDTVQYVLHTVGRFAISIDRHSAFESTLNSFIVSYWTIAHSRDPSMMEQTHLRWRPSVLRCRLSAHAPTIGNNDRQCKSVHTAVTATRTIDLSLICQHFLRLWRGMPFWDSSLTSHFLRTSAHCTQPTVNCTQQRLLTCLLTPYRQSRVLRSQSSLTNIAARRFSCCVSTVWISLPSCVRNADSFTNFRSQLKTYMFARLL